MTMKLTDFEKALAPFDAALGAYHKSTFPDGSLEKEMMWDSVIQRFEFTVELSWNALKRYLEQYGLEWRCVCLLDWNDISPEFQSVIA